MEILVVDDASSNDMRGIVEASAGALHFANPVNRGQHAATNLPFKDQRIWIHILHEMTVMPVSIHVTTGLETAPARWPGVLHVLDIRSDDGDLVPSALSGQHV